ncbi:DUF1028 domain-containing protein [Ornithinibacillus sp. 4-3]|uniref:DUF1028 domain-containing protein n=1 Tax=Ornithinibacillus sp. 4-3 TaxID=3231488 RepID=A0AB39HTV5_9BACI
MSMNQKGFEIFANTFSVAGICEKTGAVGAIVTTSAPAVGARVPKCKKGKGVVLSQNMTDPRLASAGMAMLDLGYDAESAVNAMKAVTPYPEYRQLAAVDMSGKSSAYTGEKAFGPYQGQFCGEYVASIGNYLCTPEIPEAMGKHFLEKADLPLAERLISSIEVGFELGGEIGPEHSIALVVYTDYEFPLIDLRADYCDDPLAELKRLWGVWKEEAKIYETNAVEPPKRYKEREEYYESLHAMRKEKE